jgi:prevent-host-death family protein
MKTTAKLLRMDTKRILDAVERGEEVIVSKRGKACARIVPVKVKTMRDANETALFGIWKQHKDVQDVDVFIDSLRSGRT